MTETSQPNERRMCLMWTPPKYLVVETETLPEVFAKVVYAKQLLESGQTNSISQAA